MPSPSPRDASLRRQRREIKCSDTGAPVPVPDPYTLTPLTNPDDLDARRWLSGSHIGASVPVIGLARGGVSELHPLGGVRHGRIHTTSW